MYHNNKSTHTLTFDVACRLGKIIFGQQVVFVEKGSSSDCTKGGLVMAG
jgi:hypothetical protein